MECKLCGNASGNKSYKVREMMMGTRDRFTYFQCASCGCLQITDIPDNLSEYYAGNYYARNTRPAANAWTKWAKQKRNQYAVLGKSVIGRLIYPWFPRLDARALIHLPLNRHDRILDVGCGRGRLLRTLHQLGFTHLTGADPFNEDAKIPIGDGDTSAVYQKDIHELQGQWDVIMMHHAFEHMASPLAVLQKVSQLLAPPRGYCIIRIPVTQSHAWQQFREHWAQLDAPRHLFLHSPQSMHQLAKQTSLHIQQIIYDSTAFQFWGSIQHEQDIPNRAFNSHAVDSSKSIFSWRDIYQFSRRANTLNQREWGDQAIFILKKEHK